MIEVIQDKFREIVLKCCKRHGQDVAFVLGLDVNKVSEDGKEKFVLLNSYRIIPYKFDSLNNQIEGFEWEKTKKMNFNEVLDVKFDMLGYGPMSEPFIGKAIMRFSEKHQIEPHLASIFCIPTIVPKVRRTTHANGETTEEVIYDYLSYPKMVDDVMIYLHMGRSSDLCVYLETITFSDLFSEEDIQLPQL